MHAWRDPSLSGAYVETKLTDGPAPKTKRARETNQQEVRTEKCKRPMILAKVPKYVYDTWVAKLETSNSSVKMEDLGKLRIITKPGQKEPEYEMTLATPADTKLGRTERNGTYVPDPSNVKITELQSRTDTNKIPMIAMHESKGSGVSVDGTITKRVDFRTNMSKLSSAEKKMLFEEKKSRASSWSKDAAKPQLRRRPTLVPTGPKEKYVRMEKDKLQEMLFSAFSQKPNWKILDLRNQTKQPVEWLRENLRDIAVHITKGPAHVKSTYQLKTEWGGEEMLAPERVEEDV